MICMLLYIARNNYLSRKNQNIIFVDEVYDSFFLNESAEELPAILKRRRSPNRHGTTAPIYNNHKKRNKIKDVH